MIYFLCVLDFEATCCDKNEFPRNKMEIIEFPSLLYKVNTDNNNIEFIDEFHEYVKPTYKPILTDFCINLTGIQQEIVNKSDTFDLVYDRHINWLKNNVGNNELIFATCGHWDLKTMLPNEINNKKLKKNKFYEKYINVKDEFEYFYNKKVKSMIEMLDYLNIKMKGRHHSGIDDTRNISKIVLQMIKDSHHDFRINFVK